MEADFSPADTEQEPEAGSEAVLPETPSPEYLQRKLYFLLEQLKNMHQALPEYVHLPVNLFQVNFVFLFDPGLIRCGYPMSS